MLFPKTSFQKINFCDKILSFIYSTMIKFTPTDKVNGIPISKNFQAIIKGIMNNSMHIHHSHVSGDIIGYAHSFCK